MTDDEVIADQPPPRAPVEVRMSQIGDVNYAQRIIEVIAAPYGEEAVIEYRGRMLIESIERGAFDELSKLHPGAVRVNRDHDKKQTVGKVMKFHPSRTEGLVSEVRIGKTERGDETLALAEEDMLSASLGFFIKDNGHQIRGQRRFVRKAGADHLSFVEDSAYGGARVLSVREGKPVTVDMLDPLPTMPLVDEVSAWLEEFKRSLPTL